MNAITKAGAQAPAECVTAFATLIRAGYLKREDAIEKLIWRIALRPISPERRAAMPRGYRTARMMALLVTRGDVDFTEACATVAELIGGDAGENAIEAMPVAGDMILSIIAQQNKTRARIGEELDRA